MDRKANQQQELEFYTLNYVKLTCEIEKNPNNAEAYAKRASLQFKKEKKKGALADMNKALEIDTAVHMVQLVYAEYLHRNKKYKKAIYHFEYALKLDPSRTILKNYINACKNSIKSKH